MIIFLYRWKIKPDKEKQFEENWTIITKAIREQCGSYGSRLHIDTNGEAKCRGTRIVQYKR